MRQLASTTLHITKQHETNKHSKSSNLRQAVIVNYVGIKSYRWDWELSSGYPTPVQDAYR